MSEWKIRRFWTSATVCDVQGGFSVELDGKRVRTPGKAPLVLPTRALATAVAEEWSAQESEIRPLSMPVTRGANAAIDKVARQHAEVADAVAAYGDSDLTCYRAGGPSGLVERQAAAWNPLLDWADEVLGARLIPVEGVMHTPQDAQALAILSERVHAMDNFSLTAFHDLVGLSGSLVIGFAATHGLHDPRTLWRMSRIDEDWQAEQWGADDEAEAQAAKKESDFLAAKRFHDLAQTQV